MYKLMILLERTENFQNQELTHLAWIWSFGLENLAACYLVHLGSSLRTHLINLSSFLRKSSFTRKIKRPTQLKSLPQKIHPNICGARIPLSSELQNNQNFCMTNVRINLNSEPIHLHFQFFLVFSFKVLELGPMKTQKSINLIHVLKSSMKS